MRENKNTGKIKIKESEFRILIQNVIRTVLKEDVESDQFINMEQLIDIAKKAGDYVLDAKYAVEDLGIAYGDKIPSDAVVDVLHEYDITIDDLYGGESEGLMEELVFSVNDGNKINQIFQANNIEYKYKNDGDDITFIFPSNQERENAMRLIAIAIKDKKLKIKGEGDPNYDWIHNDMFESKNNPKKIKKSEFKRLVRNTIDKIIFESKSIKENYDELDVDERSNWDEFFGFGGYGFEILEKYGWDYVDTKENDLIDSIGIVPNKRNAVSFETLLGYLRKYVPEIEVIGTLKHRYAPELRPTIFIGVRKDNNLLVKETIKRLTERKGLGKNFDAWADIESGGEYSDAVIKNKQYYNKLKNSPVDNSNIPEYYYQRGHDGPIRNIHGYTQNQIDTENNRLRKHSRYESSIDEYDD